MIRFNRTTEYGLMAMRHLALKKPSKEGWTSAREIADRHGLPFEVTAKTLQKLKEGGMIDSVQGARGGYFLRRRPDEITLSEFLEVVEGPQSVEFCSEQCEYAVRCEIKPFLARLNQKMLRFFSDVKLSELILEKDANI